MSVNFKYIIRVIGFLFLLLGLGIIPSLFMALYLGDQLCERAFSYTLIFCILAGRIIIWICKPTEKKVKIRDRILMVSLMWILGSVVGAAPYWLSGAIPSLIDSVFESASGISTTGATILEDPMTLPKALLLWRATESWLGGIGIVAFASAILPPINVESQRLTSRDDPGFSFRGFRITLTDTSRKLTSLYCMFTGALFLLLTGCGMSLYDAALHTMSTISTSGFSCYPDSIAHFQSPLISWIVIFFMFLSGINFNLYFVMLRRGIRYMLRDEELRVYLALIGSFILMIFLNLQMNGTYANGAEGFTDAAFQTVSIISTTGFHTADYTMWPTFTSMLLLLLMMIGACSFSTGSGPRIVRIIVSYKLARRELRLRIHPNQIRMVTLNGQNMPQETATNIANYMFFYFAILFAGSLLVAVNGPDLISAFTAVISCVCNVGCGFGAVGASGTFCGFHGLSKIVLAVLMIAGRLDLFAFFMLFSPHFWDSNRA